MLVGKLKHLVTIKHLVAGQDEVGQPLQEWEEFASLRADIRTLNGAESIRADAQSAVTMASIRLRYRTDITTTMRVHVGSTIYEITAVLPDLVARKHVDLACRVFNG